ncbi:MAG TPA: hypothetical protein VFK02_06085, partial [Kofleriaceae bacterium]|nr:hypothetical protein [Kofleriaceae bacterium]
MSKRDDDPQTDMEVGMTTAERRRRRRRGGGLRVPSDNVPRRASTPPVVPPVPEDPSLAMSIAYSFASESSEALPKATRESAPSFENHEGMPTVIDPVSGPVEQADFEMKTREMTAVDLEALGLSEAGTSNPAIPVQRLSNPGMETVHATSPGLAVRFTKRDATEPADDVDVDIDSTIDAEAGATGVDGSGPAADLDGALDRRITFERVSTDDDELAGEELSSDDLASEELSSDDLASEELPSEELSSDELTSDELSADEVPDDDVREDVEGEEVSGEEVSADEVPDDAELAELPTMQLPAVSLSGIPEPVHPVNETSQPRTVITEGSPPRLPISDASQPRVPLADLGRSPVTDAPPRPQMTAGAMPPLSPAFKARAQTVALSEDDLEEVREAARLATAPSGRPASTSIPPPMPPAKPVEARPRTTEPSSVPEIDILALEDKAAEASGEFEVDVEGIVDSRSSPVPAASAPASPAVAGEPRNKQPSQPPPLAHGHPTSNPPPLAHPVAASQPLPVAHHAPSQPLPAAPPPSQPPPAHGHAPAPAQSQALPLPHGPPPSPPPIGAPQARESQPMPIARDLPHASPPPPPVAHKAPPSPPPAKKDKPPVLSSSPARSELREARETRDLKPDGKPRGKPWFVELFDE